MSWALVVASGMGGAIAGKAAREFFDANKYIVAVIGTAISLFIYVSGYKELQGRPLTESEQTTAVIMAIAAAGIIASRMED